MWKIKVLKGPNIISNSELKFGDNIIGRAPSCDVSIPSPGLSKQHAKITVSDSGIYITDLNSTNGTFVNGAKVQMQKIKPSDRIGLFDVLISLEQTPRKEMIPNSFPGVDGNVAFKQEPFSQIQNIPTSQIEAPKDIATLSQNYIETVMLPGVYKLAEVVEFKWLLGLLVIAFAVVTTTFAVIPMINITKDGIQIEGERRALSIARSIVMGYERAIQDGTETTFSSRIVEREPGVLSYYIISSQDGVVMAPPASAGRRPDESFINTARKMDQDFVSKVNSNTIGAAVPIKTLDKETGGIRVVSHAVVLYDIGSLAINTDRIISLFIQVLFIALIIGAIVYFFIYKLVEFPIKTISNQIDSAIKDGQTHAEITYLFPELQSLIANINTIINRMGENRLNQVSTDRTQEAFQLVEKYPFASIAISPSRSIMSYNNSFSNLVGLAGQRITGQSVDSLNDQALILNMNDLIDRSLESSNQSTSGELEFNGQFMQIELIPIFDDKGVKYYFIFFIQKGAF